MIEFNVREIARAMEAQSASAAAAATLHLPAPEEKRTLGPLAAAVALQKFAPALSHVVLAGFVRAADFLVIAGLGLLVYAIYVVPLDGFEWHYVTTILAIATTAVLAFQWADIYDVGAFRSRVEQLSRIGLTWTIVFLFVLAVAFFAKYQGMYSRVWVSTWYGGTVLLLFAGRTLLSGLVRHWTREGRLIRRTVIVGGAKAGETLIDALRAQKDSDLSICGIFDDRNDDRSPPQVAGVPKLGTVDELVEFARRTRIDLLLVSIPITAEERVLQMVKKLWVLPIDLRLAAHMSRLRFRPRAYSYIGNVPTLDVYDKPLTDWNYVVKWLFDRIVGALLLLASAPLMALVAIAIKLDSKGPVFFRQKRYGFNNEMIEVFKFRSMYVDKTDANAAKLVTKDDARVTRVGRFIRKTSLDELPQLLNVAIKGNLSLVGPRPHAVYAKAQNQLYDEVVDGYFARHRVKPGITGWAQVNGWRGETDTGEKIQRRVEHDLYYIENWSVLFDLYILARTPFALLKTENAY